MKDLTVLANQNDPFRVDTPARHRDGAWPANNLAALGITGQIHRHGLHPAIEPPVPLCDTRWSFRGQCVRLIASKGYRPMRFKGKRVGP